MQDNKRDNASAQSVEDVIAVLEGAGSTPLERALSHPNVSDSEILRLITQNLTPGVALLDENLTYLYISDSVYEQTGFTKDQIGPGDTLERMQQLMIASGMLPENFAIESEQSARFISEPEVYNPNFGVTQLGNGRYIRLTRKTLPNGWILSQAEDVTDLAQKDEILEKALALGQSGYWLFDFETGTYSMSRSLSDTFTTEEMSRLQSQGILTLVHPEDQPRFRTALRNISRTNDRFRITTRAHRDTPVWAETTAHLIRNPDGTPDKIRAFVRDVTGELRREKALEKAKDKAVAATGAKSEFLANMSHEIRTPMNGVLGMAELLAETDLTQKQRDYLKVINSSSHSLLTIINDILDFSKIEAGAMALDPMPFDLRDAVDDVMALLASKAREDGLELIVDYSAKLPRKFIGDVGRIRQIITNLVGNAIKFTPEGMIVLTVRTKLKDNGLCAITLDVKDTGIGIAPDKINDIFKKFTQADGSTTRHYGGTGLGLTICRHILSLMGGEMRAVSEPGEGSVFTIDVDLPVDSSAVIETSVGNDLAGLKVLIVDDIEVNRTVLKDRLTLWGIEGESWADASGALTRLTQEAARGKPFDMVISDNMMPDMSGTDFAKMISAVDSLAGTPVIILSSCDAQLPTKDLLAIGVKSFLTKPVREARLYETLQKTAASGHHRKILPKVQDYQPVAATSEKMSGAAQTTLDEIREVLSQVSEYRPASEPAQSPVPERAVPATPAQHAVAPETPAQTAPAISYDILVAEDFPLNRDVVRLMLADSQYNPHFANNGKIAVEMYREAPEKYKAILMDVSMPVMDGFEASEIIKADQSRGSTATPIIALTGHALKDDREKCLDTGMDDYLTKPVKQNMLIETLDKWVKSAPAAQAAEAQKSA